MKTTETLQQPDRNVSSCQNKRRCFKSLFSLLNAGMKTGATETERQRGREVEWRDQVCDVTGVAIQHQCDLNVNRCELNTSSHTQTHTHTQMLNKYGLTRGRWAESASATKRTQESRETVRVSSELLKRRSRIFRDYFSRYRLSITLHLKINS